MDEKLIDKLKHLNKISFRGPLGMFVVASCFAFLFMLLYKTVPPDNKDILTFAAGQMLTLAAMVIGWYFGSSKEKADQEKSKQVKDLLEGETTV